MRTEEKDEQLCNPANSRMTAVRLQIASTKLAATIETYQFKRSIWSDQERSEHTAGWMRLNTSQACHLKERSARIWQGKNGLRKDAW